ncbi:MAG: hypothetical protein JRJ04_06690 [Deltaproteobacteria bacterium]|nr:hypothetical protein [Deltaproteobacteria bacterium]
MTDLLKEALLRLTGKGGAAREQADETVKSRIKETYIWLLVPFQPDPREGIQWQESRLQGQDALAV